MRQDTSKYVLFFYCVRSICVPLSNITNAVPADDKGKATILDDD